MSRHLSGILCAVAWIVFAGLGVSAQEQKPAFDPEMPAIVVGTVPAAGAKDVDPNLKEIRVTFDRPMRTDRSWSWIIHQQLGAYPGAKDGPDPRWEDDGRTCILAVDLKPGTLYAVGANSFRHTGFRDKQSRPAVPYVWVFRTKEGE
jgi:hypothetical protein